MRTYIKHVGKAVDFLKLLLGEPNNPTNRNSATKPVIVAVYSMGKVDNIFSA